MSNISILNLLYYVETLSGVNNYDYTQAFLYVMVLSECEALRMQSGSAEFAFS